MKIYLSPSGQINNQYADNKHNEAEICRIIANKCSDYLKKSGVEVLVAGPYNNDTEWKNRTKESDSFGADYHVPIHTNAGGGHGVRIFTSKKNVDDERAIRCCSNIKKILPEKWRTGGVSIQTNLYEINAPKAKTIYIECAFHDNKDEAEWIVNHTNDLAKAIASALVLSDVKENKTIYRVQVGAFSKYENAQKIATELQNKGYQTLIKSGTNKENKAIYRVQVGAFSKYENAQKIATELQNKGYQTFIKSDTN